MVPSPSRREYTRMPNTLPQPSAGGDFIPPPAGSHAAICYRIVDLGTQQSEFQGAIKFQRKILISWELPDELMETGDPFTIHQRYTWSMHVKAALRKALESWRGVPFKDMDFGPTGFQISKILGAGCLLNIIHVEKMGKTYANIAAISKLPKSMKVGQPANTSIFFDLDAFDPTVYNMLTDGLKKIIAMSPEYQEALRPKPIVSGEHHGEEPPPAMPDDLVDDIPF